MQDACEVWNAAGRPKLVQEAWEEVKQTLASHEPLPLDDDVESELQRIHARAQEIAEN